MGFARNVYFTVKDGKVDEFNRLFTADVAPMLKSEKGLLSQTVMLHDRNGVGFTLWNDKTAADTYHSKVYPEVIKKLMPVLEGTPKVENYDRVLTPLRG